MTNALRFRGSGLLVGSPTLLTRTVGDGYLEINELKLGWAGDGNTVCPSPTNVTTYLDTEEKAWRQYELNAARDIDSELFTSNPDSVLAADRARDDNAATSLRHELRRHNERKDKKRRKSIATTRLSARRKTPKNTRTMSKRVRKGVEGNQSWQTYNGNTLRPRNSSATQRYFEQREQPIAVD